MAINDVITINLKGGNSDITVIWYRIFFDWKWFNHHQ